ncbi:unnamed protein product [Alternaria alternata]
MESWKAIFAYYLLTPECKIIEAEKAAALAKGVIFRRPAHGPDSPGLGTGDKQPKRSRVEDEQVQYTLT